MVAALEVWALGVWDQFPAGDAGADWSWGAGGVEGWADSHPTLPC